MSKRVQLEARESLLRIAAFFPQYASSYANSLGVLLLQAGWFDVSALRFRGKDAWAGVIRKAHIQNRTHTRRHWNPASGVVALAEVDL
ncbi:MAG TPA: hypothetical protein VEV85_10040 [Bryobacteraceae bacterium]|nr:hypothetical protein [Bryobacteraceae bacterium]